MDKMIEVAPQEYKRLVQLEAKVQALMAFVGHTEYSVDRGLIGKMLGFTVNGVNDGKN